MPLGTSVLGASETRQKKRGEAAADDPASAASLCIPLQSGPLRTPVAGKSERCLYTGPADTSGPPSLVWYWSILWPGSLAWLVSSIVPVPGSSPTAVPADSLIPSTPRPPRCPPPPPALCLLKPPPSLDASPQGSHRARGAAWHPRAPQHAQSPCQPLHSACSPRPPRRLHPVGTPRAEPRQLPSRSAGPPHPTSDGPRPRIPTSPPDPPLPRDAQRGPPARSQRPHPHPGESLVSRLRRAPSARLECPCSRHLLRPRPLTPLHAGAPLSAANRPPPPTAAPRWLATALFKLTNGQRETAGGRRGGRARRAAIG